MAQWMHKLHGSTNLVHVSVDDSSTLCKSLSCNNVPKLDNLGGCLVLSTTYASLACTSDVIAAEKR